MALSELQGLSPELVALLEGAGYRHLNEILDFEREDILRVPGMTEALAGELEAFLAELMEEGGEETAG